MEDRELSVNEWELVSFFGKEHVSRDYGTEWYDSDSLYEKEFDSGFKLSFAIHPIHKDIRLCMTLNDHIFYDWQAVDVQDICYIEETKRTLLKIKINNTDYLELVVEPELRIDQKSGSLKT